MRSRFIAPLVCLPCPCLRRLMPSGVVFAACTPPPPSTSQIAYTRQAVPGIFYRQPSWGSDELFLRKRILRNGMGSLLEGRSEHWKRRFSFYKGFYTAALSFQPLTKQPVNYIITLTCKKSKPVSQHNSWLFSKPSETSFCCG